MSSDSAIQLSVFLALTGLVALLTWLTCRRAQRSSEGAREYFLAGGGLNWFFIAGSITLTNINTDTFVGMNGAQTFVIACWELAGVVGLLLLAKVFLPIYYKYSCTTVTELLERRYHSPHIRATVASVFLIGNVLLFLPAMLYTCSRMIREMFGLETPIIVLATLMAVVGAAYAIFGGLRAVAVSDTYSGFIVLGLGVLVVFLSLAAIDWSFAGVPPERLTVIGGPDSPVPWPGLLTGMIFTQLYYWSTNQTITQRALAAPSLREAQKGVFAAMVIRLLIVPPIIAIPGVCAYQLFGDIGDASYGRIVAHVLPHWLQGAFAAGMVAAVMTSFNSALNSSAALYVCDIHQRYVNPHVRIAPLSIGISIAFALVAIALVPLYAQSESIISTVQQLLGLISMPTLSAFIVGLLFRNVDARAVIATVVFGIGLYAIFTFVWSPLHFLHLMAITVFACIAFALLVNRTVFGRKAAFGWMGTEAEATA